MYEVTVIFNDGSEKIYVFADKDVAYRFNIAVMDFQNVRRISRNFA